MIFTVTKDFNETEFKARVDELDSESAAFIAAPLKERFSVANPNGGIKTQVRIIATGELVPGSM